MIQAVLFDLDGTLADTAPDFAEVVNGMRADRNLPEVSLDEVRACVSGGARLILERYLCESAAEVEEARPKFLELYEKTGYRGMSLYDGVEGLLAEFDRRNVLWGVVTNKPGRYSAPVIDSLNLGRSGCLVSGDTCARAKPYPDPLLEGLARIGVPAEDTLYVGDDKRDFLAAKAAGMPFVAAAWGYWPGVDEPVDEASHPLDLLGFLGNA